MIRLRNYQFKILNQQAITSLVDHMVGTEERTVVHIVVRTEERMVKMMVHKVGIVVGTNCRMLVGSN